MPRQHFARHRRDLRRELADAHPAQIAANHRGGRFGELAGIGDKAAALLQLLDDRLRVLQHRRAVFGGGREVDLAEPVFVGALGLVHALEHVVDLVSRDVDEGHDVAAKEIFPRLFAFDLALERYRRGADGEQIFVHLLGLAAEVLRGQLLIGLFHLFGGHLEFGGLGGLDLQCLVDQIAQHLHAQAQQFFLGHRRLGRGGDQRDALIDVGAGDDIAIDHGGRRAAIGIRLAEDGNVLGQAKGILGGRHRDRLRGDWHDGEAEQPGGGQRGSGFGQQTLGKQLHTHSYSPALWPALWPRNPARPLTQYPPLQSAG